MERSVMIRAVLAAAGTWLAIAAAPAFAHPPAASFSYAPEAPPAGEEVVFTSTTVGVPEHTDPLTIAWDLDGDGAFDDARGDTAKASFDAGDHVVRMRARYAATTSGGHEAVAERTIHVAGPAAPTNQPPVAAFEYDCQGSGKLMLCAGRFAREQKPHTVDASPSHDPDGSIVRYQWDFDGTGDFEVDTGATPSVTHTFDRYKGFIDNRKRRVRLRVTDDKGATGEAELVLSLLEPSCEPLATKGRLRATGLCLRQRRQTVDGVKVTRWYSEKPIKLNGISIAPKANHRVTIDLPDGGAPRIASTGAVVTANAPGGQVKLVDGSFGWKLSDGVRLSGFEVGGYTRLNGLRVTAATAELAADKTTSKLSLRLALPSQFGGATSDDPVVLTPGKATASASKPLSFGVENAAIGPIGLDHLIVTFDGEDLWEIKAGIKLPPPIPYTISGSAGIRDGEFEHAGASINFGTPGIGPLGPVFIQRISFRVEIKPKQSDCVPKVGKEFFDQRKLLKQVTGMDWDVPNFIIDHGIPTFALCGEVALTGGPTVLGAAAIGLDAGLGLATYDDRPSVFRAFGKIRLVEIPLANADLEVHTNGYTRARARVNFGIEDIASIRGFLMFEMLAPKFNALAYVDACLDFVDWCAGAKAIVSNRGVAVCLKIDVFFDDWEPGFGYRWGDTFPTLYFAGCDVGEYKEHIKSPLVDHITAVPSSARAASPSAKTIDLPAGLPGATIVAKGNGAPPKLTLIGPKGERITTPHDLRPVVEKPSLVMKDPRANVTQFAIAKPSAGRWRVQVEPGSAPVLSLASANGLDDPEIDTKVVGRGANRVLRYRVKPVAGQKVTFLERGPSAGTRIGDATGSTGRLRFRPAPGSAEKRKIVAVVTQDGEPRGEYEVTSYAAPGPVRPARPRALRVARRGKTLRLAWKASRPADVQRVTVALSDGRRLMFRTRRSSLVVRGVPRRGRAVVQVRGVLTAGLVGRPAIARIGGKER